MIFPDAITSLFTKDAAVITYTRSYFRVVGSSYLALAVLFAFQGVLRGAGDTIPSFLMIACSMILLRVPLCYYLSNHTSLREAGLWTGVTISSFAGAIAFFFYYISGKWKERGMKMITKQHQPEPISPEETLTIEPM
jgi:Na+-driven multidrug efflux pump